MAQEHQEYIQAKVNPILENLVTQLLLERPEQLAPFMIKWLSEHAKTNVPAAASLTEGVNELSSMKVELQQLQEEVAQLEKELNGGGGGEVGSKEDKKKDVDSEEEEDDEDDGAEMIAPPAAYLKKERTSVSAEAYGQWNVAKAFTPPVYPKTDEQVQRIKSVLKTSFLFSTLESKDIDTIIGAMQEKVCEKCSRLINQGDDGDCLYVVEQGQVNCYKKPSKDAEEVLVKECKAGDAFGELALLYNCPRAASVDAFEKCLLWSLDRETFNHIVRDAASKRRERYE